MRFVHDDGGRAAAGFRGATGDCVTRAIAIATGRPYREVYDEITERNRAFALTVKRKSPIAYFKHWKRTSARDGSHRKAYAPYLAGLGWSWTPTMGIGTGCRVHLRDGELPMGRLIVATSRHLVAVIDGVIHDTSDPSRDGTRCVYGYYSKES